MHGCCCLLRSVDTLTVHHDAVHMQAAAERLALSPEPLLSRPGIDGEVVALSIRVAELTIQVGLL
jgi:hypothetical protein